MGDSVKYSLKTVYSVGDIQKRRLAQRSDSSGIRTGALSAVSKPSDTNDIHKRGKNQEKAPMQIAFEKAEEKK